MKTTTDGGPWGKREVSKSKPLLRQLLALIAATQLTACSKTVQWQEEVPLNTGDTIWVKRTVVYSAQGGAGNPGDIAYRPEKDQAIDFTWNGKSYYYVQLVPDAAGLAWRWPPKIEPWLYNLRANLLLERHPPDQMKKRYTIQDRQAEDYPGAVQSRSQQVIDPAFAGDLCKKKEK
jgi:hypothetical protein